MYKVKKILFNYEAFVDADTVREEQNNQEKIKKRTGHLFDYESLGIDFRIKSSINDELIDTAELSVEVVILDDEQENITSNASFKRYFGNPMLWGNFCATMPDALKFFGKVKAIQAQHVNLLFRESPFIDIERLKEKWYKPLSHLWANSTLEISLFTGSENQTNEQMCKLLDELPNKFFICAELRFSTDLVTELPTCRMDRYVFLRAYCRKLVFEDGTRNPMSEKCLEYLHNDLPAGLSPKWDTHTLCMQVSSAYKQFVDALGKRFLQSRRANNYKLILVMTYKRNYNVTNFVINNPTTNECLELKQTIHHLSRDHCLELFDDQTKNLAPEIPFDNIPLGYALLAQIERRSVF